MSKVNIHEKLISKRMILQSISQQAAHLKGNVDNLFDGKEHSVCIEATGRGVYVVSLMTTDEGIADAVAAAINNELADQELTASQVSVLEDDHDVQ